VRLSTVWTAPDRAASTGSVDAVGGQRLLQI